MGEAGNREKGKGYHARRIWYGPHETCWHVWLEAPVTHQFRKGRGATVTFVQLHGTGTPLIDDEPCHRLLVAPIGPLSDVDLRSDLGVRPCPIQSPP